MRISIRNILLCALLLAGCNGTDSDTAVSGTGLVGDWQAARTLTGSSGTSETVRYTLELGSDNKTLFELFLNGRYDMGFEGGWELRGSDLDLTAIRCYVGDASGVQSLDECGEDLGIPTRNLHWDGRNITIPIDTVTLVFHKVASAMAAKAEMK